MGLKPLRTSNIDMHIAGVSGLVGSYSDERSLFP